MERLIMTNTLNNEEQSITSAVAEVLANGWTVQEGRLIGPEGEDLTISLTEGCVHVQCNRTQWMGYVWPPLGGDVRATAQAVVEEMRDFPSV